MVPQQVSEVRSLTPTSSGVPVFGSQLVDKNSSTPYTDATQEAAAQHVSRVRGDNSAKVAGASVSFYCYNCDCPFSKPIVRLYDWD
ncbi:hypothetical protein RR46_05773 [Papilio xuthus]|uniref:Uncharacterized protein n=1 Tax=Papilio xuthus TaxID=66420 RepID=A0A194PM57_PAPXU|nr:hypothetical protein RR46_05773 [Papilio xuthus]